MPTARSFADRLSESARRSFHGRTHEQRVLQQAIEADELPFLVAFVHGPGGIGKTRLVTSVLADVGREIARHVLDCRHVEPTPEGFLAALGGALGLAAPAPLAPSVARLGVDGRRTVLVLDTYETFGLLDTWLRQVFIPALPDNVLIVVLSRLAPGPAWITAPGWQDLFRDIELRELPDDDARRFLAARGLGEAQIRRVQRFARGYPLALELAAAAMHTQPDLDVTDGPPPRVLQQLTEAFLAGLSPDLMEAVEAASTVRRITEDVLRAMLGTGDARALWTRLQALPFVEATAEGATLHDVVRETIAADLARRDGARSRHYRASAWRLFTQAAQRATPRTLWQCTADLLYLIENPAVREGFFPRGASDYRVEPATGADEAAILEIARATDTPAAAGWLEAWWRAHPETFSVARTSTDRVGAFYCMFDPTAVDPRLLAEDPVTAAWARHLAAEPIAGSERALFLRRWLARGTGEAPSPGQAACWLDIKRTYMAWRPSLRRLYATVVDLATYAPVVTRLCFQHVPAAGVLLGGTEFHTALLDFGPDSVDGWLSRLVADELGVEPVAGRAGVEAPAARGRRLTTVLFTDIVGSSARAAELGDRRWADLIQAHHAVVRRELGRCHGREVDTAGDGFFAVFDTPADAVECASAVISAVKGLGLDVRAGVHTGECEVVGDKLAGVTVHIGARIAALAAGGEVLVSGTVRDLMVGSGLRFEDRGVQALRGIPGDWRLFAPARAA